MKTNILLIFTLFLLFMNFSAVAQITPKDKIIEVGGAVMNPGKDMMANLLNSKDHLTLLAAIKAADLVEILQSSGPFTLFAPTNAAFELLPLGTVAALLKTENKGKLNIILKYHVVAGKISTADIAKQVEAGNGSATLTTIEGKSLVFTLEGNKLAIKDEKGGIAFITIKDVYESNGIMHVIDHVLLPK